MESLFWVLSALLGVLAIRDIGRKTHRLSSRLNVSRERQNLARVTSVLVEIQETIEAGLIPDASRWDRLEQMPEPWGRLAYECVSRLRMAGGSVVPTLKRLRTLAEESDENLAQASARSAQALFQCIGCGLLVPVFGFLLFKLTPGVEERPWEWGGVCLLACGLTGLGTLWLFKMAESARWMGLAPEQRVWVLASACAGERFLAQVRSGSPADIAWIEALKALDEEAPGLADHWGRALWSPPHPEAQAEKALSPGARILAKLGQSIRNAIQASLMEGRPCLERVESALTATRLDVRAQVDRELAVLPVRAMKPLFICVAPALMGLLVSALVLAWLEVGGNAFL